MAIMAVACFSKSVTFIVVQIWIHILMGCTGNVLFGGIYLEKSCVVCATVHIRRFFL